MASELYLYNDVIGNRLVLGLSNAGQFTLPELYQGSTLGIRYYPCRPTNSALAPFFSLLDVSSLTLEVAIGPRAGAESLYAYQSTFTPVVASSYLTGTLNLNTSALNTAIGTADSITSYLEIILNDNGSKRQTFQSAVRINSCVVGPTGAVTLPGAATEYYTKANMDALFVKWVNSAAGSHGKTVTLYSADGGAQRILGVSDDGEATDDIVI